MTLEQIIKLGEMGYTKEDITALSGIVLAQVQTSAPAPVQTSAPAPVQTPAPASVQTPAPANQPDFLEALKLLGAQLATPAPAPVQTPAPAPAPVETVAPAPAAQPQISLTAEDLVKLTQGIAVQTAAGSIETPRTANDIILGMLDAYESTSKEE